MDAQTALGTVQRRAVSMIDDYHVATEFHRNLGGRFRSDGPWSGEEFREDYLSEALSKAISVGRILRVDFDGATGMPTSFIEEAFAGLMRRAQGAFTPTQVQKHLEVVAPKTRRLWSKVELAKRYIDDEARLHAS